MAFADDRIPLVSVRVFTPGEGDPVVTQQGFRHYDVLAQTWRAGSIQADAGGTPLLEVIPGVGLVCRATWVRQDTKLANWTPTGGAWEERRSATGGTKRVIHLWQYSSAPNVAWSLTSKFALPANPAFAVVFVPSQTPPDHDDEARPPFARFEFGGQFCLALSRESGARLLRLVGGIYHEVMRLPEPASGGVAETGLLVVMLRCERGKLAVSTNYGREWQVYEDGTIIDVPAAAVAFRGQGMACGVGLHQLRMATGSYLSAPIQTFTPRTPTLHVPNFDGSQFGCPLGTAVWLTDAASGLGTTLARYRATLTPAIASSSAPWPVWRSPAVYAVRLEYPPEASTPSGAYETPWDGWITEVDLEKPVELDEATATIRFGRGAFLPVSIAGLRGAKCAIYLGWRLPDLSEEWYQAFTGHVRAIEPEWTEFGLATWTVRLDNAARPFRRNEWTALDGVPLGGATVNQRLDWLLASEGRGPAYRIWHPDGDYYLLPLGLAEDPCELLQREPKWDTAQRICGYAGLELGIADDGIFYTERQGFVEPLVCRAYRAGSVGAYIEEQVAELSEGVDFDESATCAVVSGTDERGAQVLAWARDVVAETDPTHERFCPWREVAQDEVSGTATPALLAGRAGGLAQELFRLRREPDLRLAVADLDRARRDRVAIFDAAGQDIPDGTQYAVLSIRHRFAVDAQGRRDLTTYLGLWRL